VPRYRLALRTAIPAPVDEVFAFFSRAGNLGLITPASMAFRITSHPEEMREGALISYTIRIGPVRLPWHTRIERWRPGEAFVDAQISGPYRCWWHEHRFESDGRGGTLMVDEVLYTPPFGPLGRIAHRLFIRRELRTIFGHRSDAIRLRFGAARGVVRP
jgi:ligand-binding SRPBCC domain-containing protein